MAGSFGYCPDPLCHRRVTRRYRAAPALTYTGAGSGSGVGADLEENRPTTARMMIAAAAMMMVSPSVAIGDAPLCVDAMPVLPMPCAR